MSWKVPSSDDERARLKKYVDEGVNVKTMMEDRKIGLKEIGESANEEFGIPKGLFTKLVNSAYNDDYEEVLEKSVEFQIARETIMASTEDED